ncbi:hypothetical protein [Bacillus sp. PK3_68]|nr:hypothetical protein [Bacillus sp. PK3_68]
MMNNKKEKAALVRATVYCRNLRCFCLHPTPDCKSRTIKRMTMITST